MAILGIILFCIIAAIPFRIAHEREAGQGDCSTRFRADECGQGVAETLSFIDVYGEQAYQEVLESIK